MCAAKYKIVLSLMQKINLLFLRNKRLFLSAVLSKQI